MRELGEGEFGKVLLMQAKVRGLVCRQLKSYNVNPYKKLHKNSIHILVIILK